MLKSPIVCALQCTLHTCHQYQTARALLILWKAIPNIYIQLEHDSYIKCVALVGQISIVMPYMAFISRANIITLVSHISSNYTSLTFPEKKNSLRSPYKTYPHKTYPHKTYPLINFILLDPLWSWDRRRLHP